MEQPHHQRTIESYAELYPQGDFTEGLSQQQVQENIERYGLNQIESEPTPKWIIFLRQFKNVIIYILIATAILTLAIGSYIDAVIISAVIIINAFIGYFQESSAQNSVESIKQMLKVQGTVYRDGQRLDIDAQNITVGDVVHLESGDNVPADLRLVSADNLRIVESALTGEADAVDKNEEPISADSIPLADRANMAYASTSVASGTGLGVVIAIGEDTQIGTISTQVQEADDSSSPLMHEINKLGTGLSYLIIIFAVIIFIIGFIQGQYTLSRLMLAVLTMVVGSIPEGLPATTSVVLSAGVSNMAKNHHAIVKHMPAVETLGSVDIIATDKTGTLTENEMTVTDIILADGTYQVTGVGYSPQGAIVRRGNKADLNPTLVQFMQAGYYANDALLEQQEDGSWQMNGEPTDGAFITLYEKCMDNSYKETFERIDFLPFDSDLQYMASLSENESGDQYIHIKGAPGQLFSMLNPDDQDFDEDYWQQSVHQLASEGKRVIAVGVKKIDKKTDEINNDSLFEDINLLGLAGIIDPPREEVIDSIDEMNQAGIKVKMITGDHPETATSIAKKVHISKNPKAITGQEWDQLSADDRKRYAPHIDVFSRMTPGNKLEIIEALQESAHTLAMIGDGVNDAPALKQAEIGVAMGISGTDVAKDAADMVLMDDNFTTMHHAIREGRRIYNNIKKSIVFLLPTSFAEGLIIALSILMNLAIPLNASQLLWINMVSAITIQFAFVFEPGGKNLMKNPPRDKSEGLLKRWDILEIAYVSFLIALLGMAGYKMFFDMTGMQALASTIMVNIIVFGKIFYYFSMRTDQWALPRLFRNKKGLGVILLMVLLQILFTYLPLMQSIFRTTSLNLPAWIFVLISGLAIFIIHEGFKLVKRQIIQVK